MDIIVIIVFIICFIILAVIASFIQVYVRALVSNAHVRFTDLIGMKLRKVPPKLMVEARIQLVKAGLELSTNELEAHYLAGGNVRNVVMAMIAADRRASSCPSARLRPSTWPAVTFSTPYAPVSIPRSSTAPTLRRAQACSTQWPKTVFASWSKPGSRCAPTSNDSLAAPPKKPSSPVSARASSVPSVRLRPTRMCWKTPTTSAATRPQQEQRSASSNA